MARSTGDSGSRSTICSAPTSCSPTERSSGPTRREEPDLYWALRGGGGNFGVVTSMRVRLHPVPRLLAGLIVFPWPQAADILGRLGAVLAGAPDELTVQSGLVSGPDDSPALFLAPTWSADPSRGEAAIAELKQLGTPVVAQVAPLQLPDLLGLFDGFIANGRHYAIRTRTVAALTPEVTAAIVEAGSTRTSPLSGMPIHHFHGAATRVPLESTAFGMRRPHHVAEIVAAWEPDDPDHDRHIAWADSVSAALVPHALPGGYVNLLGTHDTNQIASAYGPNAARLLRTKARFDPDGVFSATPLPPPTERLPELSRSNGFSAGVTTTRS